MKMICNKAGTCEVRPGCVHLSAHPKDPSCGHICVEGESSSCVPVRPKRKPVTVWVVYKDHPRMTADENHGEAYYTRNIARQAADELRADGFEVRGPVKVSFP